MPRSMTGFARAEATIADTTVIWELRSVNHRYLETHFRLPDTARELESTLREQLRKSLHRGKVEISLSIKSDAADSNSDLTINLPLLRQLTTAINTVEKEAESLTPSTAIDLLKWPGVMTSPEQDREQLLEGLKSSFNEALKTLVSHREREGAEIKNMIDQRLSGISENVVEVRKILPEIQTAQQQKIKEKLDALNVEIDQSRFEQELVYLLQKSDVDEELDRLDAHVIEVKRALSDKGSIGRRLDFLMQELNREANTLSSKSIVADTTQAAVDLKVLIEQMREQIQNIE